MQTAEEKTGVAEGERPVFVRLPAVCEMQFQTELVGDARVTGALKDEGQ